VNAGVIETLNGANRRFGEDFVRRDQSAVHVAQDETYGGSAHSESVQWSGATMVSIDAGPQEPRS
jgi:hypothetical protein